MERLSRNDYSIDSADAGHRSGLFDQITFLVQVKGEPLSANVVRAALARAYARIAAFNIVLFAQAAARMQATALCIFILAFGVRFVRPILADGG